MSENMIRDMVAYEENIQAKWRDSYFQMKEVLCDNIPEGFELRLQYGMPTFVVPLSKYPTGYLNRKDEPLPFISLAAQKNYLALYHMGLLENSEILSWFKKEYEKQVPTKLNMGKSCIRFTNSKNIPYQLIGELVTKISMNDWIEEYSNFMKKKEK